MSGFRGMLLTVAATVALIAALAAGASGAANSTVTVGFGFEPTGTSPVLHGQLRSGRKGCIANRPVRIYRLRNQGKRVKFGSTRSAPQGGWRVPLTKPMKTAAYVVVVKAKPGCAKGVSDPIAVGQRGPDGLGPGGTG